MPRVQNPYYDPTAAGIEEGLGNLGSALFGDPAKAGAFALQDAQRRLAEAKAGISEDELFQRENLGDTLYGAYDQNGGFDEEALRANAPRILARAFRAGAEDPGKSFLRPLLAVQEDPDARRMGAIAAGGIPNQNSAFNMAESNAISARDAAEALNYQAAKMNNTAAGQGPNATGQGSSDGGLGDEILPGAPERGPLPPGQKRIFEYQGKVAGYARRAKTANDRFTGADKGLSKKESLALEKKLINPFAEGAQGFPLLGDFVARLIRTPEQQVLFNNASEFIRAKLRKESGAQITTQEWATEYPLYFPVAGDSDETIANKEILRATAIDSMIRESTGGYEYLFPDGNNGPAPARASNGIEYPPEAAQQLADDPSPEAQAEFDDIFGPGASASVLGGQ